MRQRKPSWRQDGAVKKRNLRNNECCDKHKSVRLSNTCEINHETYCSKAEHKRRHSPVHIFRTMEEREAWVASHGLDNVAGGDYVESDG